jgi:hypothetical protein
MEPCGRALAFLSSRHGNHVRNTSIQGTVGEGNESLDGATARCIVSVKCFEGLGWEDGGCNNSSFRLLAHCRRLLFEEFPCVWT